MCKWSCYGELDSRYGSRFRFFFPWYRRHGDLPSFPTRRSSDLVHAGGQVGRLEERQPSELDDVAGQDRRSEEHTSELQSRFDLVCRLLLEKKKNDHADALKPQANAETTDQLGHAHDVLHGVSPP